MIKPQLPTVKGKHNNKLCFLLIHNWHLKNLLLIHCHAAGAVVELVHYRKVQRPEYRGQIPGLESRTIGKKKSVGLLQVTAKSREGG
jgi:hypothetical protein